jgi:hypothetical protein
MPEKELDLLQLAASIMAESHKIAEDHVVPTGECSDSWQPS